MGIISGSIWGSFQGWGSFRGRDHFGGCTDRLWWCGALELVLGALEPRCGALEPWGAQTVIRCNTTEQYAIATKITNLNGIFFIDMLGSAILCFLRHRGKYLSRTYVDLDSYSYETQASNWCLRTRIQHEWNGSIAWIARTRMCNWLKTIVALARTKLRQCGNHDYKLSQWKVRSN